jgi:hypothetical protein
MKIHQLISGPEIAVTNEEQHFMDRHEDRVKLTSLDDHDQWLAQSLVRRGVYKVAEDNVTLVKNVNEKYSR